ncbi:lytic transglycosylase domain-containing protein [Anaerofilum sp. BX8]|uniref:Lytic transglycosylase domain-containing protein n=1 Tax=Anaerofilum hominis TaxID=2763016 RepID=A0A923IAH0_9FIRM|nr:lytic transglycosylase domain-containing protein [Anaerofilum hominis]MBC5582089.1 lytic transglycosylase domain-containing protein [Anaerofilum hominis]
MRKTGKNLIVLAVLLAVGLLGLLTAPKAIRVIEEHSFPLRYKDTVEHYAAEFEMDPLMIYAIIRTESGFDQTAESAVGARGLMQITEETFAWIKLKIANDEPLTFEDLWDPSVNIRFGSYYLSRCLERYGGNLATASAAYHSGWGTVDSLLADPTYADGENTLKEFPYPQMSRYVQKVGRAFEKYERLYRQKQE